MTLAAAFSLIQRRRFGFFTVTVALTLAIAIAVGFHEAAIASNASIRRHGGTDDICVKLSMTLHAQE
jgi:hypothetical protein